MKKRGIWLAALSTLGALLAAVLTFTSKLDPNDEPKLIVEWLLGHQTAMAFWLLAITSATSVAEGFRAYLVSRHQSRLVLQKILNDLSKSLFINDGRNNRITLFNVSVGWKIFFWGMIRLPKLAKMHKWRALWRLRPQQRYLGSYLRPTDSRGRNSMAAFRISDDDSRECEGIAGLIWDCAGQKLVANLAKIDRDAVRRLRSQQELEADPVLKDYAAATNSDFRVLHGCDNFARHYYGTLIRTSDGTAWGVLLLDSFEDDCPFLVNGNPSEVFMQRFNDYARLIGKIVG